MNLFDITLRSMKKNVRDFFLYFFSMIISIVLFYILKSIEYNKQVRNIAMNDEKIQNGFFIMSIIVVIFVVMFIWYSNSFFMEERKREIALYNMLGLKKSEIAKMLFYENFVMGIGAIIVGLVFGILFSKFFTTIFVRLMGFDIKVNFEIPFDAVIYAIVTFLLIFILTSIYCYSIIYRFSLLELFKAKKKVQKEPKTFFLVVVISVLCIVYGYYLALNFDNNGIQSILKILFFTIIGTYMFFIFSGIYIIKKIKTIKKFYVKGMNLIIISGLYFRNKNNAVLLATISILCASTITAVGTSASLYYDNVVNLKKVVPFDFVYEIHDEKLDNKVQNEVKKYDSNEMVLRINAKTVKVNTPILDKHNIKDKKIISSQYRVISLSELNKVLVILGNKRVEKIKDNHIMIYYHIFPDEDYIESITGEEVYYKISNENKSFIIEKCVETTVFNMLFNKNNKDYSLVNTIVVNDKDYKKFVQIGNEEKIRLIKLSKKNNIETITNKVIDLMDDSYFYNKNSYGNNSINISTYYEFYTSMMNEVGMTVFLTSFIGIVFLICTGSMIFFKQLNEALNDKEKYLVLNKLGVSKKEVLNSIKYQIAVVFCLPFLIGALHSIMAFKLLEAFVQANIWYPIFIVMMIYMCIYLFFYKITIKHYFKIVS